MNILNVLFSQAVALVERIRQSVVGVEVRSGFGSAIVWDAGGLLLTNAHVAQQEVSHITLPDGRKVAGRLVSRDRENDLALLVTEARNLVPIERGDSRRVRPGELVLAVGHPLGLKDAASMGIVNRTDSAFEDRDILTTDLKLAPGNSGGPVTDASGRLLGVASMIAYPGVALAVPTHVAEAFVQRSLARAA